MQPVSTKEIKTEKQTESPLSHELRTVLRTLPSSVVVLTTTAQLDSEDDQGSKLRPFRGMTLSSFTSLTLSPEPVVTFNIRAPSKTLEGLLHTRHFLIHILDSSAKAARIANYFTMGNERRGHTPFLRGEQAGLFSVVKEPVSVGDNGLEIVLPRLRGAAVTRVLRCEVLGSPPLDRSAPIEGKIEDITVARGLLWVGDHILVLGKVEEILDQDGDEGEGRGGYGLSYVDGSYRNIGPVIPFREAAPDERSALGLDYPYEDS
jgi:flavin reductase (DIM6/NTAB) family NADH-FMN oxidoreductase RutF